MARKKVKPREHHTTPSFQAYQILRFTLAFVTLLGGLDKFFNYLTCWPQYFPAKMDIFNNCFKTMMGVGIIEIILAIGLLFKPRVFGYIVMVWLLGSVASLLAIGGYCNIALIDLGLAMSALALARLSYQHN